MPAFVEEKPTMELRWSPDDIQGEQYAEDRFWLQQKWLITRGGEGNGVEYTEEWRDVPIVNGGDGK